MDTKKPPADHEHTIAIGKASSLNGSSYEQGKKSSMDLIITAFVICLNWW